MESVVSFLNGLFSTDTIKYVVECIFLLFAILIIINMEPFCTIFKVAYSVFKWIFIGLHIVSKTIYKKITKRDDFIDEFDFNFYLIIVIIISSILFLVEKGFTGNLFENGFDVKEFLLEIMILLGSGFIFIGGIAMAFAIVIGFFYSLLHQSKGSNSSIDNNDYFEDDFDAYQKGKIGIIEYFERKQIKEYNEDLQREISRLENERDRIITGDGLILSSGLTEDDLKRNRHRRDKLNEKIEELKSRLK